eukprot:37448-Eustigmatos_ZCMA.PRE.1
MDTHHSHPLTVHVGDELVDGERPVGREVLVAHVNGDHLVNAQWQLASRGANAEVNTTDIRTH